MKIAVNTRYLLPAYLEGCGNFIFEVFSRLARRFPQHEFVYIFDRPFDQRFITSSNIKAVVVGPPARHPLLWKLWYDIKIPVVLRKQKADVFVSADGFCSLTTHVPQCLVVHDLAFLHHPSYINRTQLFYYKRYTPYFLKKAASIATVSSFSKRDIVTSYGIDPERIDVVYNGVRDGFKPLDELRRQEIRDRYTEGKNFFLCSGAIQPRKNLINLLKAFSVFKKRQKSDWKLVLAGRLAWKHDQFTASLKKYKYRADVVLTGYIPDSELETLTASAYALVYPSLWEGFGVPVLEAMRCRIPVLTSVDSSMAEIAGDAALYASPGDYQDIAEKMMRLYKDEALCSRMKEKGAAIAASYSWDRTADLVWDAILKALPGASHKS